MKSLIFTVQPSLNRGPLRDLFTFRSFGVLLTRIARAKRIQLEIVSVGLGNARGIRIYLQKVNLISKIVAIRR